MQASIKMQDETTVRIVGRSLRGGQERILISEARFLMVRDMATLEASVVNAKKKGQLIRVLEKDLAEALRRGFFGTVTIEAVVQDGTIQQIRHQVERIER